jgi:hypothetical protein
MLRQLSENQGRPTVLGKGLRGIENTGEKSLVHAHESQVVVLPDFT